MLLHLEALPKSRIFLWEYFIMGEEKSDRLNLAYFCDGIKNPSIKPVFYYLQY